MVDLKTLRDWFVIFLILLFLPKDNTLAVFDVRPEDWYGEVRIPIANQLVILAKNSNREAVSLGVNGHPRVLSLQRDQEEGVLLGDASRGLPESVMVITADRRINIEKRVASINDKNYFQPGPLSLLTRSDFYVGYLLVAFLIGGFMVLGFLIARYGVEEDAEQ